MYVFNGQFWRLVKDKLWITGRWAAIPRSLAMRIERVQGIMERGGQSLSLLDASRTWSVVYSRLGCAPCPSWKPLITGAGLITRDWPNGHQILAGRFVTLRRFNLNPKRANELTRESKLEQPSAAPWFPFDRYTRAASPATYRDSRREASLVRHKVAKSWKLRTVYILFFSADDSRI